MTPDALARLHAAAFADQRTWSASEFAALLPAPGVVLLEETGGFALARVVADEAELLTLAVDPALRRRGIARRVMARFDAAMRDRGAEVAHLEVAADNLAALGLYASAGFTESGRRAGYFRRENAPAVDAVLLRKCLT